MGGLHGGDLDNNNEDTSGLGYIDGDGGCWLSKALYMNFSSRKYIVVARNG